MRPHVAAPHGHSHSPYPLLLSLPMICGQLRILRPAGTHHSIELPPRVPDARRICRWPLSGAHRVLIGSHERWCRQMSAYDLMGGRRPGWCSCLRNAVFADGRRSAFINIRMASAPATASEEESYPCSSRCLTLLARSDGRVEFVLMKHPTSRSGVGVAVRAGIPIWIPHDTD